MFVEIQTNKPHVLWFKITVLLVACFRVKTAVALQVINLLNIAQKHNLSHLI